MSVKVTFRTLKGATFKLDALPSDSVLDLKRRVGEQQGVDDHAGYRLIYKGKILSDAATVTSAGITSTGFVVVMPPKKAVSKTPAKPAAPAAKPAEPPAAPAAKTPPPPPAPASSAVPMDTSSSDPSPPPADPATSTATAAAAAATATSAAAAAPDSSDPASTLVTGAAYDASVKQICEMGFPEDQVKKALRAAFNNPERAVDYLFNGIPEPPAAPAAASAAAAAAPPAPTGTDRAAQTSPTATPAPARSAPATAPTTATPGTPFNMFETQPPQAAAARTGTNPSAQYMGNLDFLRTLPQFNMMRRVIQANPSVLPQLLQQLEEFNPSLLATIDANQAEFTRLINEPLREGEDAGSDEAMDRIAQALAGAGGPGAPQPGPGQVVVTEEEHEQILRLSELGATIGLEESDVVETWLACNRDETLAANFLVDHADELRADTQRNNSNANPPNQPDAPDSGEGGPPA